MTVLAKVEGLTGQQRRLATELALGKSINAASKLAGYANPEAGREALSLPAVQSALRQRVDELLLIDAAYARRILRRIAQGTKTDPKLKRQAAVDLMSRGGFVPPKAPEPANKLPGTLSELTPAQLRALVDAGQRALADRAAPIIEGEAIRANDAPLRATTPPDIADLLG